MFMTGVLCTVYGAQVYYVYSTWLPRNAKKSIYSTLKTDRFVCQN